MSLDLRNDIESFGFEAIEVLQTPRVDATFHRDEKGSLVRHSAEMVHSIITPPPPPPDEVGDIVLVTSTFRLSGTIS